MKFVEKMRELQAKATPGPLKKYSSERWNANAALVATTINALPAILDALEAAEEAHRINDNCDQWCEKGNPCWVMRLGVKLRALDALVTPEASE